MMLAMLATIVDWLLGGTAGSCVGAVSCAAIRTSRPYGRRPTWPQLASMLTQFGKLFLEASRRRNQDPLMHVMRSAWLAADARIDARDPGRETYF